MTDGRRCRPIIGHGGAHPGDRRRRTPRRDGRGLSRRGGLSRHHERHRARRRAAPQARAVRCAHPRPDAPRRRRAGSLPAHPPALGHPGSHADRARRRHGPRGRPRDRRRRLPAESRSSRASCWRGCARSCDERRRPRRATSSASAAWRSIATPAASRSTARNARSRPTSSRCSMRWRITPAAS